MHQRLCDFLYLVTFSMYRPVYALINCRMCYGATTAATSLHDISALQRKSWFCKKTVPSLILLTWTNISITILGYSVFLGHTRHARTGLTGKPQAHYYAHFSQYKLTTISFLIVLVQLIVSITRYDRWYTGFAA